MPQVPKWDVPMFELVRRTSVDLPADVERAIRLACRRAPAGSTPRWALETVLANAAMARKNGQPICQDTGLPAFFIKASAGFDVRPLVAAVRRAVARATRLGILRENTIDGVTGRPCSGNVTSSAPVFYMETHAKKQLEVRLLLKGGGSENVGRQYSLPDVSLSAGRDMAGVRRCVLDAVWQAQGNGCAPGVLSVCVGGDRSGGYAHAKSLFLQPLGTAPQSKELAILRRRLLKEANELQIGPMGLGGAATLLDLRMGALDRVPASFFVTVSYMCWAYRRHGMVLNTDGSFGKWLYGGQWRRP